MQQAQAKGAMERAFRPDLLALRRRMLGLSQIDLSRATGISQGTISKIEQGIKDVSTEHLEALTSALKCETSFFFQIEREYGAPMSTHAMFRKKAAVGSKVLDRVIAELNVRLAHLRILVQSVEITPELVLPQYSIDDFEGGAAEIAKNVRRAWYMPRGPVKSLTDYVERTGCLIVSCDLSEAQIDGVSYRIPGIPPVIFINQTQPADRQRFTLAHELGHLVMHQFPEPDMEQQANEFASELLMPRDDIISDLRGLSLEKAAQLKPYWRVSMAALTVRAKAIRAIDDQQSERLWKQFSFRRFRTREPAQLDFPAEQPSLFPALLRNLVENLGYTPDDLVSAMHLKYEELGQMYGFKQQVQSYGLRLV